MIVDVVYFVFYEMKIVVASIEAVKSPNTPDVYERKTATAVVRCRVVLFINITLIEVLIAASACVCTYYVWEWRLCERLQTDKTDMNGFVMR